MTGANRPSTASTPPPARGGNRVGPRSRPRRAAAWLWQVVVGHDVFISYSRSDAAPYARALKAALVGRSVFVDTQQLEPGSVLARRVGRAARTSSVMLVLLSEGAVKRPDWIRRELAHAAGSALRPVVVPVVFEPLEPASLPDPFELLQPLRMVCESRAALVAGAPTAEVLAALLALWYRGRQASVRDTKTQRWLAAADRAAARERFDLAELAVAQAVAIEPSMRPALAARYEGYRARRVLLPGGAVTLAADERVLWAGDLDGALLLLTRGDVVTSLRGVEPPRSRSLDCEAPGEVRACDRHHVAVVCGNQLVSLAADGHVVASVAVPGEVVDLGCAGAQPSVLTQDESGLRALTLTSTGVLEPEEAALGPAAWLDAGLCAGGDVRMFGARLTNGALFLVRGGDLQGGEGAVVRRIDRGEILTATVNAAPACDRFFIQYTEAEPATPAALGALPARAAPAWVMVDWDGLVTERELPATIGRIWPVPASTGAYAVYLTTTGELGLLPLTDAVVATITPEVVATGVAALGVGIADDDAPRQLRTYSLEGDSLVVRDRASVVARYRHAVLEPSQLIVGPGAAFVLVAGDTSATLWRRAAPAVDRSIPPPRSLARTLGLRLGETLE